MALPVFKEIAEKTFRTNLQLYPLVNDKPVALDTRKNLPDYGAGFVPDIKTVLSQLNVPHHDRSDNQWGIIRATHSDALKIIKRPVADKRVPNVLGMGLRDAFFLLENQGLKVEINGRYGRVRQQSIRPGTKAKGQTIWIRLG